MIGHIALDDEEFENLKKAKLGTYYQITFEIN